MNDRISAPLIEAVASCYRGLSSAVVASSFSPETPLAVGVDLETIDLTLLRLERDVEERLGESSARVADWRARVEARFGSAIERASRVEDPAERDYLRRTLVDAAIALSPEKGEFFLETSIEPAIEAIEDYEERQAAIYPLALYLASRLPFLSYSDVKEAREKIDALLDALDDQNAYERALGAATAGTMAAIDRLAQENPADAERVGAAFHKTMENLVSLETPEGLARFYDETTCAYLDKIGDERLVPCLVDSYAGLERALELVESALETGEREEESEDGARERVRLSDDELDDLRFFLKNLNISNPIALERGEKTRAFAERFGAFGTALSLLVRLREADEVARAERDDPRFARRRLLYPQPKEFYDGERDAWFELAEKLARDSSESLEKRAEWLADLASAYFLAGKKSEGRALVREILGSLKAIDGTHGQLACLKTLIEAHLKIGDRSPAARLAELLEEKIANLSEPTMVDYKRADVFPLYLRVFSRERAEELLGLFKSGTLRALWSAAIDARDALLGDPGAATERLERAAQGLVDSVRTEDPAVAATSVREFAAFLAEELARFEEDESA
ncbi:MAG: hypothetical protein IJM30_09355 [Thermoguttaceae bacterium]|nr:hypothetical protein [Thermoguttaceae bacterium]